MGMSTVRRAGLEVPIGGLPVVIVLLLALVAPHAFAGKASRPARLVEIRYEGAAIPVGALHNGSNGGLCLEHCYSFALRRGETRVLVEVQDDLGLPVYFSVGQDSSSDAGVQGLKQFCGAMEEPLPVRPGMDVVVIPWTTGHVSACPGALASTSVIKVTFTR